MINLFYDLHIHSCLSPCGSDDMTPYNIAGMAALKGLDVIAVTDHNSCKNCPAVLAAAKEYGILAVPGMEINTSEEVHAVCLFKSLEKAMEFDAYVYGRLLPVKTGRIYSESRKFMIAVIRSAAMWRTFLSAVPISPSAVYGNWSGRMTESCFPPI